MCREATYSTHPNGRSDDILSLVLTSLGVITYDDYTEHCPFEVTGLNTSG